MSCSGAACALKWDRDSTFVYPDMTIVRGEPNMNCYFNQHTFDNPILIIEIFSPSTEKMDRTRKKELYLQLESLQAYILLSQGEPRVEMFRRQGDCWRHDICADLDATLVIETPDCEVPLSEIYQRVRFENA